MRQKKGKNGKFHEYPWISGCQPLLLVSKTGLFKWLIQKSTFFFNSKHLYKKQRPKFASRLCDFCPYTCVKPKHNHRCVLLSCVWVYACLKFSWPFIFHPFLRRKSVDCYRCHCSHCRHCRRRARYNKNHHRCLCAPTLFFHSFALLLSNRERKQCKNTPLKTICIKVMHTASTKLNKIK